MTISNDDHVAMEIVERTIKRIDQYKFQIAVPFRHINPNMPNNSEQAVARLYHQRRMLCKNSDARGKYMEKIKRLKDEGYIERVHPDNYQIPGRVWFLPHFATKQEKFRVVYDGSAEFQNQSINAEIFHESDLLVPLFDVITCFRVGKYAIIADLKKCFFFQIGIPPE